MLDWKDQLFIRKIIQKFWKRVKSKVAKKCNAIQEHKCEEKICCHKNLWYNDDNMIVKQQEVYYMILNIETKANRQQQLKINKDFFHSKLNNSQRRGK